MRPEVAKRLVDARDACTAIRSFTQGFDFAAFSKSALVRAAVERQFEIIGEALGRAVREDATLEEAMPEVRRIVGLRNRLIHGYDSVDEQILWDLIQNRVPSLHATLERQLSTEGY